MHDHFQYAGAYYICIQHRDYVRMSTHNLNLQFISAVPIEITWQI